MRRLPILISLVLFVAASAFGASGHFILSPKRLLTDQEQADLAGRGLVIEQPLANGRYLVRVASDSTITADDPRVASLMPLTGDFKLHRSALREVAKGKAFARLNLMFFDGVSFESAKAAIEAGGGTLVEPLQREFHFPRRIAAIVHTLDVATIANDERVMLVYGPLNLKKETHNNSASASLSNVTPLFSAPYNLSGAGVALTYFELAAADAAHPEFGGRLTIHTPFAGNSNRDVQHATHTAGTMIAAGLDPFAKGMAPGATLDGFDANADALLDIKQDLKSKYSSVADNNSWGYVLGWSQSSGFTWEDNDIYFGGYDFFISAALDQITRETSVLMVHSAGNDGDMTGPTFAPFLHSHYDNNDNPLSGYCYSADGTGNDCPAPTCKAGPTFCEKTRHPQITSLLPAPWVSVGLTASAKNVIAVGAVDTNSAITSFSSRGPARDGRVKPDLVTNGLDVYSTFPGAKYGVLPGTSMAAPVVTGASALLVEQWRRTFGSANPTAATLKTLMLGTARDLGNRGPDYTFGFGLLDAKAAVDTIIADGGQSRRIKIDQIATGGRIELPLSVTAAQNLRVTLGWADPEVLNFPVPVPNDPEDSLAAATLVNDLDVKLIDASGAEVLPYVLDPLHPEVAATRGVNHTDNTEVVEITNAPAGSYRVIVSGTSVTAKSPQQFIVVSNADLGVAVVPCVNPFAGNDSQAAAYGNVVSTQSLSGRTCEQTTSSFFKFLVDKAGTVSVTVTTTDTPVRVTLSSGATQTATADVPAGTTRTVSTTYTGNTATTFFARVEATGTVGSTARYTITPAFPNVQHAKRRAARRG